MKLSSSIILFSAAVFAAGCSSGNKQSSSDAENLLEQAREAVSANQGARALALLDSLTNGYPSEVECVRGAIELRPKAIEIQTLEDIYRCDSTMEASKKQISALRESLKWVREPRMVEGFWVDAKTYNPSFMNTTAIQARVSEIGEFYIVSSVNPGVGHTALSLSDGGRTATTPAVPYDGESNYRIAGGEVITFSPEQSDSIGKFAAENASRPLTLRFTGGKGKTMKLSAAQTMAIANAYLLAKAMEAGRNSDVERQRLQKQLELARSQQERLAGKTK